MCSCKGEMAYTYDRRADMAPDTAQRRRRQKGKAKMDRRRRYRRERSKAKRRSKQYRRQNRSKIKRYQKKYRRSPTRFKMKQAYIFAQDEVRFWDLEHGIPGCVEKVDPDTETLHALIDGHPKDYDALDFLDEAALEDEESEDKLLSTLDEIYEYEPGEPDEDDDYEDDDMRYSYDRRVAKREKVELKLRDPNLRAIGLEKDSRGWTYWFQGTSGAKNAYPNRDRGMAKAKLIYTLKNEVQVPSRQAEKYVSELDAKFDSGVRPPSKKEQMKSLVQKAMREMASLDVDLPAGWQYMPLVTFLTTDRDAGNVKRKLQQLGLKNLRVEKAEDAGYDDPNYPALVSGDPDDLIVR